MLFKDVIGQERAKKGLFSMFFIGRLPHALLISGKEGVGGLPMALAIAQYIFCSDRIEDDACGVCSSCKKTSRLIHPDLHMCFPTVPSGSDKAKSQAFLKEFRAFIEQFPYGSLYQWLQFIGAENKQGKITAEECREIREQLQLRSYEGGPRVQIIWHPEYFGKEGNILLKLIEEPPENTYILLVTAERERLLSTITSRTQLVSLSRLPVDTIAEALQERMSLERARAYQIAHISDGNFNEALRLAESPDNDLLPVVRDWFNALFTNNGIEFTKWVNSLAGNGREQQKNFLKYVIQLAGHSIRFVNIPDYNAGASEPEVEFCRNLAKQNLEPAQLQKMVERIGTAIYRIERNAHSKTQLLALSIELVHLIRKIPQSMV